MSPQSAAVLTKGDLHKPVWYTHTCNVSSRGRKRRVRRSKFKASLGSKRLSEKEDIKPKSQVSGHSDRGRQCEITGTRCPSAPQETGLGQRLPCSLLGRSPSVQLQPPEPRTIDDSCVFLTTQVSRQSWCSNTAKCGASSTSDRSNEPSRRPFGAPQDSWLLLLGAESSVHRGLCPGEAEVKQIKCEFSCGWEGSP